MPEKANEVDAVGSYSRAWSSYTRRFMALGFGTLALVPTFFAIMRFFPAKLQLGGLLFVSGAWLALWVRANTFRCPRCGQYFFWRPMVRNPFARRCLNCGLPKWAAKDEGTQPRRARAIKKSGADPAIIAIGVGWSLTLSCALALPLLLTLNAALAANPLIPPCIPSGIATLTRVVAHQSPFICLSRLALAISAARCHRGVKGAARFTRVVLVLMSIEIIVASCTELLGITHEWRDFCFAFKEIFRNAPRPVVVALSLLPVAPIVFVPIQVLFCALLYRSLRRAERAPHSPARRPDD